MINIAIDGPSGSGKSTLAKNLAKKLNFLYLDTGAMYRAVAYYMDFNQIDFNNKPLAIKSLDNINLDIKHTDSQQYVILNDVDVSKDIRKNKISLMASLVSQIIEVRKKLVNMQRKIANNNHCVMDGRDIGTYVLPNAQVKIFLIASPTIRAKRRQEELLIRGEHVEFDDLLKEILERDEQDATRDFAPLKKAEDAVEVDTTNNTIEETLSIVEKIVQEKIGNSFSGEDIKSK